MAMGFLAGANRKEMGFDPAERLDHAALGVGGVLLESTEWQGGLRDRRRAATTEQSWSVDGTIAQTIAAIKDTVFPYHAL